MRLRPATPRRLARRMNLGTVDLDETDVDSVDSRLAAGSPAYSPLVRMYGSIFMSFRRGDQDAHGPLDGLDAPARQMLGFRGWRR